MNKKDLEQLGIEDEEVIQKIIVLHGKDIEALKTANSTLTTELGNTNAQLKEANTAIEGFKTLDVEGVKKAADEWKQKAEQTAQESAAEIKQLKLDHAVDLALTGAKAKNSVAVKALLDSKKFTLGEDNSVSGLKEQLDKIKADNDYLFEADEDVPQIVTGGKGGQLGLDVVLNAAKKAAGLSE